MCMGQIWPANRVCQLEGVAYFKTWAVIHSAALAFWRWKWLNMKLGFFQSLLSSLISQKGESQSSVSRKQRKPHFPKNEHFLPPDTHTYMCVSRGKKCSFFGKFGMLCFLETPILKFALLPYYRRYVVVT